MNCCIEVPLKAMLPKALTGSNQKVSSLSEAVITSVSADIALLGHRQQLRRSYLCGTWECRIVLQQWRKLPARDTDGGASMREWKKRK